jgi:hypothetical protein
LKHVLVAVPRIRNRDRIFCLQQFRGSVPRSSVFSGTRRSATEVRDARLDAGSGKRSPIRRTPPPVTIVHLFRARLNLFVGFVQGHKNFWSTTEQSKFNATEQAIWDGVMRDA